MQTFSGKVVCNRKSRDNSMHASKTDNGEFIAKKETNANTECPTHP
jgi:hypothetical protein